MSLSCLSLPFLRRARLPGLWASGLPERARCSLRRACRSAVWSAPARWPDSGGPRPMWKLVPAAGPARGKARRWKRGGPVSREQLRRARGLRSHFRSVPASSAAFPRCLRSRAERRREPVRRLCEGRMRPRAVFQAGWCLRTRLWPGGWGRRGALGRSVTARVLSVRSAAPPGGPGAEPGFDDALH